MNLSNQKQIPHFPRKYVYFEKQSDDRLCGLHCLNNLLQGPYLDVITLSEIGIELDKLEKELTGVHSQNNVDNDGNFGIQVLQKALSLYVQIFSDYSYNYFSICVGNSCGSSSSSVLLIILIVVICLIVVGIVAFFVLRKLGYYIS